MKKKYFIFIGLFVLIAMVLGYCWSVRPTVSVVMLTYKRAGIVSKAIDSVLNQTYKDFEFIILNDGSPDNTDEIINKYKDKRIRYYKNDKNRGISYSRNRVTKLARGKYIMIMDDDDVCLPRRMEKQVKFLEENPNIDVVAGQIVGLARIPLKHDEIASSLIQYNSLGNANVMMRNDFVKKNKIIYDENFKVSEDWDFWVKMLFNGAKFGAIVDNVLERDGMSVKHYGMVYEDGNAPIRDRIGLFFNSTSKDAFYNADGCDKLKMIKPKKILSDDFVDRLIAVNCH